MVEGRHHNYILSISYCKEKSKNMKRKIQLIESELEQIEHQHHLNINMVRKKEFENELDASYEITSKGQGPNGLKRGRKIHPTS